MLENKLGITSPSELAKQEEKLSKLQAHALFEQKLLDTFEVGTFQGLSKIHHFLFHEIYDFAGKLRTVNLAKGNFRFAPVLYLEVSLQQIDRMPHGTFEEIVEKYVEMNIAHPFREGNGRATRLWLDNLLKKQLKQVVDWSKVDKNDYLLAMERSPIKDIELKFLLQKALVENTDTLQFFSKGIDASYHYEGYHLYKLEDLANNKGHL